MIRALQRLFESTITAAARAPKAEEREHGYHLATAALLVEMMRADYEVRPEERGAVLRALGVAFGERRDCQLRLVGPEENIVTYNLNVAHRCERSSG